MGITTISLVLLALMVFNTPAVESLCTMPKKYQKSLFSIEGGKETDTIVKETKMTSSSGSLNGDCDVILKQDQDLENSNENILAVFLNATNNCYFCYQFFHRSNNIIQYQRTQCQVLQGISKDLLCSMMIGTDLIVGFQRAREDTSDYNCKSIIEGIYQFTFRLVKQTGVCDSPNSLVKACQKQGSPLRDNSVFTMRMGWCAAVESQQKDNPLFVVSEFTWRCLGRWVDKDKNIWGAIEYDTNDIKFKYRCINTRIDQQNEAYIQQWGMTVDADCTTLKTFHDAPLRLVMRPAFDTDTQVIEMQPGCKLPVNFTGNWFYPGEYNTQVTINSTHIYFLRRLDQYRYEEIYFVCRQSQESRYMMATVTKGKCDVDFVCFYFMPRHHNIIRFRMGRPYRLLPKEQQSEKNEYMMRMFRESCHWNSFTLNYLDWVYEYFILDPPVPINCPIQGRFKFQQKGQDAEKYKTKIPFGVTPRPRVQVICGDGKNETDLAACVNNPKQLRLDTERCMRLDFTGRPISEYDIADNILTCVGYWMEDTKSFLITYDPEDPVTNHFRCWVYRRLSYHNYLMSRSQSGRCSKYQTADTFEPELGASLRLELYESELEFDGCPMSWDDGRDPYGNPSVLNVYGGSPRQHNAGPLSLLATTLTAIFVLLSLV